MIKKISELNAPFLSPEEISEKTKHFLKKMPFGGYGLMIRQDYKWKDKVKGKLVRKGNDYEHVISIDPEYQKEIEKNYKFFLIILNILKDDGYILSKINNHHYIMQEDFQKHLRGENGTVLSEVSQDVAVNLFAEEHVEIRINLNTYSKILDYFGYKKDDLKNNKAVIKELEIMENFYLYIHKDLTNTNNPCTNTQEDIDNFLLNHSDFIKMPKARWVYKRNVSTIKTLMENGRFNNEFRIAYFENYLEDFISLDDGLFLRDLISHDNDLKELFKTSKKTILKSFYDQIFETNNTVTVLDNYMKGYQCVVSFSYKSLREDLPFNDKTKITDVFNKMESSGNCTVIKYDQMMTIIVPTEVPVKSEELEDFISKRFIGWVFNGVNFFDEINEFTSSVKEQSILKNIGELDKDKKNNNGTARKKI